MKRMIVNAQVTATTTLLELLGNVTYAIHIIVTGPSLATLSHGMMVYTILLPYVFLMNTSHNKNRIIENGWKNVLRNIIGWSNISIECNNNISQNNDQNQHIANKQSERSDNHGDNEIITTTTSQNNLQSNNTNDFLMLHVPFNGEPSTSRGQDAKNIHAPDNIKLGVNKLAQPDHNPAFRLKLISAMIKSIEDEKKYIGCFKKLVAFEGDRRKGKYLSGHELENEFSSNCKQRDTNRNKKSRGKGKRSKPTITQPAEKERTLSNVDVQGVCIIDITVLKLKGKKEDRISMRTEILNQLRFSYHKDENYDILVEELINLEESFVQDY